MKYLVVIGDGMADNPVEALGGKTPLEYADIPTIDSLAARGTVGSVVNCPKPLPAGSETAILSIFGCDPLKHFSGRSPMEAAAIGLRLVPGDAAFRCNLVARAISPMRKSASSPTPPAPSPDRTRSTSSPRSTAIPNFPPRSVRRICTSTPAPRSVRWR